MSHLLRSNRLEIRVREPGEVYRASRFDWSTNVDSILLDGKYQFASAESLDPADVHTRGSGLHSEFGIRGAPGYDTAKTGEYFYKIGVGQIRRENAEAYNFYKLYKDIRPSPTFTRIKEHEDGQELEFKAATALGQDYGWKLVRSYRVANHSLRVKVDLTNTGRNPIVTTEYCHNFIKLGDKNVGPDYELGFNFPVAENFESVNDKTAVLEAKPGQIPRFVREPDPDPKSQFWVGSLLSAATDSAEKAIPGKVAANPRWTLRDRKTGLTMSERLEGPCARVDMWGMRHVCSVELFAQVDLQPGASQSWVRHYTFGAGD